VYGWLGVPVGKGPFPAILTLPYAGVYPLSGSATGEWIGWAQKDFIAMGISIHNCEPDLSAEAYKKLPQFSSGYYAFVGRNNRETSYFLRAFLGCIRAIDYLTSRPDWDKKNMIVTGSSQGGGLSIVTAGLDSRVTAMAANVPALCEHTGKFSGRPSGWPNLVSPKDTGVVANVSTYFDAVNFARHIQSPTLISVGFIDTTCPPMTVYSAFNVIPGEKQILPFPLMGHSQIKKYIEIRDKWIIKQVERRKN
jgi:cephalosporin-C deacetylase-like acetyl esterase